MVILSREIGYAGCIEYLTNHQKSDQMRANNVDFRSLSTFTSCKKGFFQWQIIKALEMQL